MIFKVTYDSTEVLPMVGKQVYNYWIHWWFVYNFPNYFISWLISQIRLISRMLVTHTSAGCLSHDRLSPTAVLGGHVSYLTLLCQLERKALATPGLAWLPGAVHILAMGCGAGLSGYHLLSLTLCFCLCLFWFSLFSLLSISALCMPNISIMLVTTIKGYCYNLINILLLFIKYYYWQAKWDHTVNFIYT